MPNENQGDVMDFVEELGDHIQEKYGDGCSYLVVIHKDGGEGGLIVKASPDYVVGVIAEVMKHCGIEVGMEAIKEHVEWEAKQAEDIPK